MVFSGLDQAFQGRVQGLRPPRLIGAAEAALRRRERACSHFWFYAWRL